MELLAKNESVFGLSLLPHGNHPPPVTSLPLPT